MHPYSEVLITDVMPPSSHDLSQFVDPIFWKEVVQSFDCSVFCNNIVPPLDKTQFHPFLPQSVKMTPHFIKSDMFSQMSLLAIHVVFEAFCKFKGSLYARFIELRNQLILIYLLYWITRKFKPAWKSICSNSSITCQQYASKFCHSAKLVDITLRNVEEML